LLDLLNLPEKKEIKKTLEMIFCQINVVQKKNKQIEAISPSMGAKNYK
jgi:hypothetical protein